MITHWQKNGGQFRPSSPLIQPHLDVAVYTLEMDMGGIFLDKKFDDFDLGPKVYDLQPGFVDRVVATHSAMNRSIGVLLQGLKGAGKTVVAKQLCNASKLPVLILQNNNPAFVEFLAFISQPCVVFIDEYEKLFDDDEGEQNVFLSLMDGAISSTPHIFVLTVNKANVNENMFDRPGRVRYCVQFDHLPKSVVEMIVDDLLAFPEFRTDVLEYLSERTVLSVDSVRSVVEEINIHGTFDAKTFDRMFNLSKSRPASFDVYEGDSWFGSTTEPYIKAWLPSNNANNYNSTGAFTGQRFVQTKYDGDTQTHTLALLRTLTTKERDVVNEMTGSDEVDDDNEIWDEATQRYVDPASFDTGFNQRYNSTIKDEKLLSFLSRNSMVFLKYIDVTIMARPTYHESFMS